MGCVLLTFVLSRAVCNSNHKTAGSLELAVLFGIVGWEVVRRFRTNSHNAMRRVAIPVGGVECLGRRSMGAGGFAITQNGPLKPSSRVSEGSKDRAVGHDPHLTVEGLVPDSVESDVPSWLDRTKDPLAGFPEDCSQYPGSRTKHFYR